MSGGSENDDHPIVPTNIPTTSYFNDNMVTMTGAIGSPEILRIELIESEIGLPATPEKNLTIFTNESIIDDG